MVILVAIGGDTDERPVIETANDLATTYNVPLMAMHVIPEEDSGAHIEEMRSLPGMDNYSIDQQESSAERVAEQMVRNSIGAPAEAKFVGRVGSPAEEILSVASELDPRFVVIGGRKRSPTGKALFGSVTQSVLLQSERPVVTVLSE